MELQMAELFCTVMEIREGALLVCDHCNARTVVVHTELARCFCPGDRLCVLYSGAMTMSIPPQLTAADVTRVCFR